MVQVFFSALYGPFMNCPDRACIFAWHYPGLRSLRSLRPGLVESAFQAEEKWLQYCYVYLLIDLLDDHFRPAFTDCTSTLGEVPSRFNNGSRGVKAFSSCQDVSVTFR